MRKLVLLFAAVVVCGGSLYASDAKTMMSDPNMTGQVCNSKCVYQVAAWPTPHAACSSHCSETSGDQVFIDEFGKATKIDNPELSKRQMSNQVMKGAMTSKSATEFDAAKK